MSDPSASPRPPVERAATPLARVSAQEALALFRRQELSPVDLVADCLERIEAWNPVLNAFCHVDAEGALAAARAAEARWRAGAPAGALDGIPVTIKDLTLTRGMPTRKGSATSSAEGPWEVDAPITARMRAAGAVILGKTTSPEFGWKGVTDNPLYGVTRNPWNFDLTPGGSSGGAGVAAALNLGLLHQGSDAGGSIRIPASFTGTFGFKPTFGHVAQWPPSAMTTLSHLGPMTRTVADAQLMMAVITGPDARDGYAGPAYPPGPDPRFETLAGWRIAYSRDLGHVRVAPDIAAVIEAAVAGLADLGAEVVEVDPGFADPIAAFETLWFAGAARILETLSPAQQERLDPGFREIAEAGRGISLARYQAAGDRRFELAAQMAAFHETYDLLVTPAMPIAPFAVGRDVPPGGPYDRWTDWTPFTYPFNLTQQPAASIPCGLDAAGLPVGLQLVGPRYGDRAVLAAARLFEEARGRLECPGAAP